MQTKNLAILGLAALVLSDFSGCSRSAGRENTQAVDPWRAEKARQEAEAAHKSALHPDLQLLEKFRALVEGQDFSNRLLMSDQHSWLCKAKDAADMTAPLLSLLKKARSSQTEDIVNIFQTARAFAALAASRDNLPLGPFIDMEGLAYQRDGQVQLFLAQLVPSQTALALEKCADEICASTTDPAVQAGSTFLYLALVANRNELQEVNQLFRQLQEKASVTGSPLAALSSPALRIQISGEALNKAKEAAKGKTEPVRFTAAVAKLYIQSKAQALLGK